MGKSIQRSRKKKSRLYWTEQKRIVERLTGKSKAEKLKQIDEVEKAASNIRGNASRRTIGEQRECQSKNRRSFCRICVSAGGCRWRRFPDDNWKQNLRLCIYMRRLGS